MPDNSRWGLRLDLTVPVALIVTMAVQALVVAHSLGQQANELANLKEMARELVADRRGEIDRLARIETKVDLLMAPARSGSIPRGG